MNFPVISSQISSSSNNPMTSSHVGSTVMPPDSNLGISPALLEGTPSLPGPGDKEASGGLVYGAMGAASAWWTPIQAQKQDDNHPKASPVTRRHLKRISTGTPQVDTISPMNDDEEEEDDGVDEDAKEPAQVEMVAMSTRPRLRKVDDKGQLVWPFELETVLIAGLRKYHATSCRPRPSASRNFNRNKLVAEYIQSMTGIKRTTKQIASRIQVLRETWRGKKEFTLVAQPRELSEMGYLPPFEGQIVDTSTSTSSSVPPVATEDASAGPGPVRNARRTTRKTKGGKADKRDKRGRGAVRVVEDEYEEEEEEEEEEENGFDEYQPQPSQQQQHHHYRESTRVSRHSLKSSQSHPQLGPARNNRLLHHPSLAPAPAPVPTTTITTTVTLDPYRLDTLGPPQASLENLLPPSALFFVRNTLRRGPGKGAKKTTIIAKCTLSSSPSMGSKPEVQILLEIDPASVRRGIEAFQETRAQRVKLGSSVQLLQSSAIWDEEGGNEDGGDAGLVERLGASGSGSANGSVHRYALELQLPARQALASNRHQVIVVQNLSLLRVSDSRLVDSWAIVWVVGMAPRNQRQRQPRLELVPISDMPDASQRERGMGRGEGPSSSSRSRIRIPSPVESQMFSSPELTPSPILPTIVAASSFAVEDIISPLPHSSFPLSQQSHQSDYSLQVDSPEGSPLSALSSPSPMELAPLSLPLEEDVLHAAGRVCTPLSLTLPPVMMTELINDSPLYVPMPVQEIHEEFVEDIHMRSRFSQSQARLEAPEHDMTVDYPAIMHQEHLIPSILHNYTASPNYTSPPSYTTPPQMPSPPPPPPVISYPVIQHHIASPSSARPMIRDNLGSASNVHPSLPVHYRQMHHSASHIIPDEWRHAGHDHLIQNEVDPRYEEPSSYHHRHPVYLQHVQTPPNHHHHHHHQQHEPQFAYVEEVMQEPVLSPTSAGSTSSQQTQFHMVQGPGHGYGQPQPLVEQGWYPVGSPVRGVSPGPSYPYRRFSEASLWGGADSYPSTTRTSFSSSGRGASVPPVPVNGIDMPPPPHPHPTFHPIPHPTPVQYVFVDDSFNVANEALASNAYISDDTSGHRSQHQPGYHHLQQHAHMMLPMESSVYGVYQY